MSTYKPDFPMTVDSTMRGAFTTCPQKFFRTYYQHWKPRRESVDLVAGKAFAAAMEEGRNAYWKDGEKDPDTCITRAVQALIKEYGDFEPPEGHVKTLDRMIGAVDEYFHQYGFATDHIQPVIDNSGKPAVELSFALPIPGTVHPTTGEPILYTGRYDMLGLYNGAVFVVDEKTTKQLGQSWFKNWTMRSQITGYCWAGREFGYPVAGAIIRGISILKTKYGHAESIQYRSEFFIDLWLEQLRHDINRMIQCWKEDYWDFDLDSGCTMYGGCNLADVCSSQHPQRLLETNFTRKIWDPLAHEERQLTLNPEEDFK